MKYLLVNHVALGHGNAPGTYRIGDLWLADLRAQARAITDAGMRLVVATPCVPANAPLSASGSFNTIEITPAEQGFEYVPLPRYLSMREYLRVRKPLQNALRDAMRDADVVQLGYGGHPIALGQVAWPIAGELGKKRIWIFDGADPFPRLELDVKKTRNPIKKFIKRRRVKQFEAFCRDAVAHSTAVFAHNASVVKRFAAQWGPHCHAFDRSFVTDEVLIDPDELARRQGFLLESNRPLRLVVAGRQIYIKGTDQIIRALAKARRLSVPIELDVLGDGEDLNGFKRLAAELKVAEHVRFLGTVPFGPELFDVWDRADVMVVTNLTAEISRNILLSCARGLPLVTYTNPGTDQMLKDADAAILVPRADIDRLADAFIQAQKNRARLAELAVNGWKLARTKNLDETHRRRAELAGKLLGLPTKSADETNG